MPRGGQGAAEEETDTLTLDELHSRSSVGGRHLVQSDHSTAGSGWGAEAARDWTEVDLDLGGVSIHLPNQGIEFRRQG